MMKHSTPNNIALSGYQVQALRRNKLEHHRLELQVISMRDDVQQRLARLQRQARHLQSHYTNVVRVVKPSRRYQLWKETHAHEIEQAEKQKWLEEVDNHQRSKRGTDQSAFDCNTISQTSTRPFVVIYKDNLTPSIRNCQHLTSSSMRTEYLTHLTDPNRLQSSRPKALISLPLIVPAGARRFNQEKRAQAACKHRIVKGAT